MPYSSTSSRVLRTASLRPSVVGRVESRHRVHARRARARRRVSGRVDKEEEEEEEEEEGTGGDWWGWVGWEDRGAQGGPRGCATAHQPPHQVRGAGLRIVRVDGPHSAEVGQRVGATGFATLRPRHELSESEIQILELGLHIILRLGQALSVKNSPYLNDGWKFFGN